jgi:hypothetical protein
MVALIESKKAIARSQRVEKAVIDESARDNLKALGYVDQ